MAESFAIIGGGMLGLTLALRLANAGKRVTVFESASEIGGLASAWQLGDIVWDKHYHVTLLSDMATRGVLTELGLQDELRWVTTKTGFYTDGKLVSMSNAVKFLKFPPLGLLGKFRLGATIFYASKLTDWQRLEQIPVADWLTGLSGKQTFEKIWLPLLRSKLGDDYKDVSAAFIWATIARMYAARRTGLKQEMFGYVRGGYAKVFARFAEVLREKNVEIKLNCQVRKITSEENGGVEIQYVENYQGAVKPANFNRETVEAAVLTVPTNVAAQIVPQFTAAEKQRLNNVRYQGIVCASLLLKKPLADYYVTNITDDAPFTAVIEMSALVDKAEFGGNALVYLPKYVAPDDKLFDQTDDEIRASFVGALERMYKDFRPEDVLEFCVSRVRQVFPLPTINYSKNLPEIKTSVPNVFVVNSAHIVNGTLNVNETVRLAEQFLATEFTEVTEQV